MLTKLLEKLGYIVNSAQSGEELIEIFQVAQTKGITYKFLILDIVIPNGMSGDLALKEILKIDPTVKAIVSSGYSQNPVMSKYQKYGFAGVLTKPYTVDELKNVIADF
jgi:CheY-like chemotaxis protein